MTRRDELLQVLAGLSDEAIVRVIAFACEEADRSDLAGYPPALANAPFDDEPWTEADAAAVAEAEAGIARSEPAIPADEVWADLLG